MAGPVADQAIPRLPRGTRFRFDETRGAWVLLGPERLLVPDETAAEILKRCDGERSVGTIITELAAEFDAPEAEIGADVRAFIAGLREQGLIEA
ncbi:pyrroloquinoline quinone biosynthesis peptide chaperone PqqD [Marinivivus vitaminiproducens]|uniref:pyrroloquinoline quinone biosynthesis peptide chaperone PqqD n=1 Tax=Marinivivus vitaminiproducens TaxID=3035935 RepID=UPI00279B5AC7|nr:pyrroloquinoline quinone biosynthesis peptide chaperone PqqD [Geminicoccaceae bacterium SCSIO 64248]